MKCDRCGASIQKGEDREHQGQLLCEDCYMDAMSPMRACDPWAVYSAKSFEQHTGGTSTLTAIQKEILQVLEETGGIETTAMLDRFRGKLDQNGIDRELATLRHMEKLRGEKRDGKVFVRIW